MTRQKNIVLRLGSNEQRFVSKQELASEYSVSRNTFGRYLRKMERYLPDYQRSQQLLTPAQVRTVREVLG